MHGKRLGLKLKGKIVLIVEMGVGVKEVEGEVFVIFVGMARGQWLVRVVGVGVGQYCDTNQFFLMYPNCVYF